MGQKCVSLLVFLLQKIFTSVSPLTLIALHPCACKWITISGNRTDCMKMFGFPAAGASRDAWGTSWEGSSNGWGEQKWVEMEPAQPPEQKPAQATWLRLLPGIPGACWPPWSSAKKPKNRTCPDECHSEMVISVIWGKALGSSVLLVCYWAWI